MAKKLDARVYAQMSAKELFVVLEAAYARQDFAESARILASAPKLPLKDGIDPQVTWLARVAGNLAGLFLFDLLETLSRYRGLMLAASALCIDQGIVPFGIGKDEEALAQFRSRPKSLSHEEMARDLPIIHLRDAQSEAAQEVSAILAAIRTLCEEEVGISPEQLVGATAPYGLKELAFAASIHDLDPKAKVVKAYLERYRMLWKVAETRSSQR